MTLATETAYDALQAAFTGVPNLPALIRNDRRLTDFTASGVDGIARKFIMYDEAPEVIETTLGEPPQWELRCVATFAFMVEGEAGAPRDSVWNAGVEAIAATLFPGGRGLVVSGAFEDLRFESSEREHYLPDPNRPPVEKLEFTVSLIVTAATPFG